MISMNISEIPILSDIVEVGVNDHSVVCESKFVETTCAPI